MRFQSNVLRNRKISSHFQLLYEKVNRKINAKVLNVFVKKFENYRKFSEKFFQVHINFPRLYFGFHAIPTSIEDFHDYHIIFYVINSGDVSVMQGCTTRCPLCERDQYNNSLTVREKQCHKHFAFVLKNFISHLTNIGQLNGRA